MDRTATSLASGTVVDPSVKPLGYYFLENPIQYGELYRNLVNAIKTTKIQMNSIEVEAFIISEFNKAASRDKSDSRDKKLLEVFGDILYREEFTNKGFDLVPELLRTYNEASILKYTGITFDKYLQLPITLRDTILVRCKLMSMEETAAMETANQNLKNIKVGGKT